MSILSLTRTRETYLSRFSTQAEGTLKLEKAMLARLDDYITEKYSSDDSKLMAELALLQGSKLENTVMDIIQGYANFMLKRGISIRVAKNYTRRVKSYFNYILEMKIHSEELKQHVKFPKEVIEDRYPLKVEEAKKILDHANDRKGMYLFMIGAGMPIEETVRLRKRDFSLYQGRWMVKVPGAYRKVRKDKISFVSKESETYFLERHNRIKDDDLVWGTNVNPKSAVSTEEAHFYRVRERAGFRGIRYENSNHHKIGMHSFRAYFITKASKVDHDLAHAICGHDSERYMSTYDRYELKDLLEFYKKAEPKFSIFDNQVDEQFKSEIQELRQEIVRIKESRHSPFVLGVEKYRELVEAEKKKYEAKFAEEIQKFRGEMTEKRKMGNLEARLKELESKDKTK